MKGYIARDFNGSLRIFNTLPERHSVNTNMDTTSGGVNPHYETTDGWWGNKGEGLQLHPNTFKNITWYNEPKEVVIKIKL